MSIIEATGVTVGYGATTILHEIDLRVDEGEVVALLGANGAGKTTALLALAGELPIDTGSVTWKGKATQAPLHQRVRDGLAFVTEERSVFTSLTCEENLRLGRGGVAKAVALMPELEALLSRTAGLLSGGEQQILTLARALAAEPQLLLADELSLGLAPLVVDRLLGSVRRSADAGAAVLLVEQHVSKALAIADRAYVLQRGRIVLEGPAAQLNDQLGEIEASYLSGL